MNHILIFYFDLAFPLIKMIERKLREAMAAGGVCAGGVGFLLWRDKIKGKLERYLQEYLGEIGEI